ncbi:hypothetical protein EJ110_NYTH57482 [Nymphaea thermarum]|nr:hypothetical protein EJ110_NYTH57482 [Nymphaea thermarum]
MMMMLSSMPSLLVQAPLTCSHLLPPNLCTASRENLVLGGRRAAIRETTAGFLSHVAGSRNLPGVDTGKHGFSKPRILCFSGSKRSPNDGSSENESRPEWRIFRRWEVPWKWQTVVLTMFGCGLSFFLTGLVEASLIPYLGIDIGKLSLDEKAEILFVDQFIATAIVLGVVYGITSTFKPFPEDIFCYRPKEPFNLQNGWILWAGIGLLGAVGAIAATGAVQALLNGESPQRETDALVRLLPLIGSSNVSTACLLGITGVLAPVLEETVFRGFLMVSLTKWFPTPVAVISSATVFALAHLTPGEFPQLFVLGVALGLSYAQTRNLLTPITIHAFWNSGVILLLSFLQIQGYDIRELLQAP